MKQADGMFEHVGFEKARDPVEAEILADAAVDRERHVEALRFVVNFMEQRRTVQRRAIVGDGRQQSGDKAQLLDAAAQFQRRRLSDLAARAARRLLSAAIGS